MELSLVPIVDERLQELDQGEWTGQPRALYDVLVNKSAMAKAGSNFAPPGGQSINDVANEMDDFMASLLAEHKERDQPVHIWVHTHGVNIKAFIGRRLYWSHERTYKARIDNTSITRVALDHDLHWKPVFINRQTDR